MSEKAQGRGEELSPLEKIQEATIERRVRSVETATDSAQRLIRMTVDAIKGTGVRGENAERAVAAGEAAIQQIKTLLGEFEKDARRVERSVERIVEGTAGNGSSQNLGKVPGFENLRNLAERNSGEAGPVQDASSRETENPVEASHDTTPKKNEGGETIAPQAESTSLSNVEEGSVVEGNIVSPQEAVAEPRANIETPQEPVSPESPSIPVSSPEATLPSENPTQETSPEDRMDQMVTHSARVIMEREGISDSELPLVKDLVTLRMRAKEAHDLGRDVEAIGLERDAKKIVAQIKRWSGTRTDQKLPGNMDTNPAAKTSEGLRQPEAPLNERETSSLEKLIEERKAAYEEMKTAMEVWRRKWDHLGEYGYDKKDRFSKEAGAELRELTERYNKILGSFDARIRTLRGEKTITHATGEYEGETEPSPSNETPPAAPLPEAESRAQAEVSPVPEVAPRAAEPRREESPSVEMPFISGKKPENIFRRLSSAGKEFIVNIYERYRGASVKAAARMEIFADMTPFEEQRMRVVEDVTKKIAATEKKIDEAKRALLELESSSANREMTVEEQALMRRERRAFEDRIAQYESELADNKRDFEIKNASLETLENRKKEIAGDALQRIDKELRPREEELAKLHAKKAAYDSEIQKFVEGRGKIEREIAKIEAQVSKSVTQTRRMMLNKDIEDLKGRLALSEELFKAKRKEREAIDGKIHTVAVVVNQWHKKRSPYERIAERKMASAEYREELNKRASRRKPPSAIEQVSGEASESQEEARPLEDFIGAWNRFEKSTLEVNKDVVTGELGVEDRPMTLQEFSDVMERYVGYAKEAGLLPKKFSTVQLRKILKVIEVFQGNE